MELDTVGAVLTALSSLVAGAGGAAAVLRKGKQDLAVSTHDWANQLMDRYRTLHGECEDRVARLRDKLDLLEKQVLESPCRSACSSPYCSMRLAAADRPGGMPATPVPALPQDGLQIIDAPSAAGDVDLG